MVFVCCILTSEMLESTALLACNVTIKCQIKSAADIIQLKSADRLTNCQGLALTVKELTILSRKKMKKC